MSIKKYIALIAVVIALSAGAYVSQRSFIASRDTLESVRDTPRVASSTTSRSPTKLAVPATPATEKPQPSPNATLSVGSTTYPIYAPEHSSVLDAMRTLTSTGALTFTAKDFPGLGAFIESIHGKKNADGYYWILYVNGRSSDTGASQTTLKAGDAVEWRYEKGY